MKNIIKILFVGLLLAATSTPAFSTEPEIVVSVSKEGEYMMPPKKGHRVPGMQVFCVIDFISKNIKVSAQTGISHDVVSYELWDEYGEVLHTCYFNDYEMVEYMSNVSGTYKIRLIMQDDIYFGYVEL